MRFVSHGTHGRGDLLTREVGREQKKRNGRSKKKGCCRILSESTGMKKGRIGMLWHPVRTQPSNLNGAKAPDCPEPGLGHTPTSPCHSLNPEPCHTTWPDMGRHPRRGSAICRPPTTSLLWNWMVSQRLLCDTMVPSLCI